MSFYINFTPDLIVESPGRINLIGEHTDYNLGYVLPTAIDKKITLKLRKNNSADCNVYSLDNEKNITFSLNNISPSTESWENYILGVLHEIQQLTDKLEGFDCVLSSTLPIGSGLSSSAALECGLAFGLNELFDLGLSKIQIVHLSRAAEHNYVGTKCGIMDQYASVMSKSGYVIKLDCRSLASEYIPLHLGDYKLLLLNTKISHSLADSEYNTRLAECSTGVEAIKTLNPSVVSLRDVDASMLEAVKDTITATVFDRCAYIIEENERVLHASEALTQGDLTSFGTLMYGSHDGLQHKYEVSCPELDFMVAYSRAKDFILGSRMMGGGFGGCTINLIHKDAIEDYISEIASAYKSKFNIELDAYIAMPAHGTMLKTL
ncbi:galactokinase [Cellulophaga algicola DSM 14237]|uniref:Galactokinase n=1 Tax=Cellulophaga algicola (strain DSM 14237 / IC166 / ACAM 630) TaxID=688270 RepID=E6XAW1_CELAD|nr:galactokinase [Cellulophaga algicola]ADV47802.1 galactokinase [Cellulophaga algicola DSM 14237]